MRTYDAMPLKPFHEDRKEVLYNELNLQRYSMAELVEKALEGNANCREWLGYSIERKAPRIIPDGYRYDVVHSVLIPPGYAYCTGCKVVHPVSEFYVEKRNTGRSKTRSQCRMWMKRKQKQRDQRRMVEKLPKWKRG